MSKSRKDSEAVWAQEESYLEARTERHVSFGHILPVVVVVVVLGCRGNILNGIMGPKQRVSIRL